MRLLVALIGCLLLAFTIQAQTVEVCNDGIDNDGNGLVDCADSFCSYAANIERGCNCFDNIDNDGDGVIDKADPNCASYYGLEFVGEGSNCSLVPPGGASPFAGIGAPAVSGQNTADTQSKVSVGDVDGDGVPDAIITSKWNSTIRVVATSDGQADGSDAGDVKSDFKLTGQGAKIFSGSGGCNPKNLLFEHENLIADIDKDGVGELFGIVSNRSGNPKSPPTCFYLVAFRYAPGTLVPLYDAVVIGSDRPGVPGIADMDGDGKAEIYIRDRIYAAETGKLLATSNGNWDLDITSGSVAVNMTGDNKMELVCGTKIFSIPNLTNRNPAVPAALVLFQDMNVISPVNKCFVKLANDPIEYGIDTHSMTSVADIDRDGFLDVVISGALNSAVGKTAVFYWNVQKGKVSFFLPPDPVYPNGWPWGTGRVNLGDANGDGKTDLTFMAGNQLFCMTTDAADNIVPLWATPRVVNDSRSGVLTVSIYDFDNDGNPEMVYRDSQELVVIDGATGQNKIWSAVCQSHTYTEGVVIADVNGDGATDICVTCNRNNSFDINADIQQQALGEIRLFFTNGNEWLPTRKVWNQPGYFVVNIKDDLTLPFPQLDQNLIFSNGPCPNGTPGPQMPMNVFLNQVPFLSAEGCPVFPAPDLTFFGDDPANPGVDSDGDGVYTPAVEVTPPICGNLDISAFFNIVNSGDLAITDNVPVGFFNGDPLNGGTYLHNTVLNINNLQVGQTLQTPPTTFNGPGTVFTLYIVLYSDGSLPLVIDNTKECSITNNTYTVQIAPDPFTVTIEKISDNFKCDNTAPDNGELRVRIFKGGVEDTNYSSYSFQWYNGIGTGSPIPGPAGTDYIITDRAEGDYSVVITNTSKGCESDFVSETILRLGNDPEITINVLSDQTQCSPANGQLEAVITGGNTGFTFEWFDISLNPLGIVGPIANNLTAGNYLVRVSKDGCTKISNPATVNGPQIPDAQAQVLQNVVDCSNPNSGAIQADALFNAVIQDPALYQFDWYFYDNATSTRGSILPPAYGSGQTRTGLPAGFYQAEIKQISTQCISALSPVVEVQTLTVIPTAVITELAPQTSCDTSNPNGILTADALIGGVPQDPANFTFEWFEGDNTLPANAHGTVSDVNGKQADEVKGGGIYYTVRITTGNNCSVTEKLIITENVNVPIVTLTPSPNSICDPAKASSTYNGSVTASVTFDGAPVAPGDPNYTYSWHDGSFPTDPAPSPNSTTEVLSQQDAGNYTLVVTRTDLFCPSLPATEQIVNATVLPALTTSTTPSTNCVPGIENGVAEVLTVDGGPVPGANYAYDWTGPGAFPVTPAANNSDTPQLINLQGGAGFDYTVLVTNQNTGCENTATLNVADAKVIPVITLAPTDNGICDPLLTSPPVTYNGRITASVTNQVGALTDYNFTFGAGMGPGVTSGNIYDQLNGGPTAYTATATHTPTGCVSSLVSQQVDNVQSLPVLTTSTTASTNCVPGLEDGIAEIVTVDATAVGSAVGYTYAWTGPVAPAFPVNVATNNSNTPQLIKVQGGAGYDYTAVVTNQANGCQTSIPLNVADAKVIPVITLAPTDNGICDPALTVPPVTYSGMITATVTNQVGPLTDYSFAFGAGMGPGVTNGNVYEQLNGGPTAYTATATHTLTGCVSSLVSQQVDNVQSLPVLTTSTTPSTNCVAGLEDGIAEILTVDATAVGSAVGYTYAWTGPVAPAFPVGAGNNFTTPQLINVQGGAGYDYTAVVTNQANGCQTSVPLNVADAKVIPVITLAPTDNGICDPALTVPPATYSGMITATVTNQVGPLTDYTFTFGAGMGPGVTNGNVYEQLNGGPTAYTATATHTLTGCVSSLVSQQVDNVQSLPVLTTSTTPSTNCVAGLEDGIAEILTVDATAVGAAVGYTYAWTGPVAPAFPVGAANNFLTPQLINVQGGAGYDYTAVVTNQANGCQTSVPLNVADAKVIPVITLAPTDNGICNPALTVPLVTFSGMITATVTNQVGPLTDYSFAFGAGMGPGVTNGNVYEQLNGGPTAYTATATHTVTGCVSPVVSQQVDNVQALPVLTTSTTPSTNCVAGLEDGIAEILTVDATAVGAAVGYTYAWTGPVAPAFPVGAGNNFLTPQLINVQGGFGYDYTAVVTNQANGCQTSVPLNVADAKALPVLTLTPQPNTICDPAIAIGGAFDGQVSAVVDAVGNYVGNVPGDFTFNWNTGLSGVGQNLLANRDVGTYSVTAQHTNTGCTSGSFSAQVTSAKTLPSITTGQTPSTNCAGGVPDGVAQVLNVLPNGNTYDYNWYDGNSATGGVDFADLGSALTTSNYAGVQGGVIGASLIPYTVEVTILQTGCINTATVGVSDDSQVPILGPLTPTDNTLCTVAKNGSATVSTLNYRGPLVPPASYGDFTFNWSGGTQGPPETTTALAAGNYTLTVQHIASQCTSNPVAVTIADNLFFPAIDVAEVDQTSCDPGTPNGSLTATIDEAAIGGGAGVTAGYTFTWVDDVTSGSTISNFIGSLKGDQTYSITAVRDATQCTSTQVIYLNETLTTPTINVVVTPLTICQAPNGELNASVLPAGPVYEFFWYDGNDAVDEAAVIAGASFSGFGAAGENYTGLIPGDYTVVVRDDATKCQSLQVIETVPDTSAPINPVAANTVIPVDCNVAGGTLDGGVQFINSDFSALAATDELTTVTPLGLAVDDQIIIKRNGALTLPDGIEENKRYFIESIAGNVLRLKLAPGPGLPIDLTTDGDGNIGDFSTAGYSYEWYADAPSPTNPALGSINYFTNPPVYTGPALTGTSTLAGIATGLYTIEVTDLATNCKSYLPHTLPFLGSHAVVKINKTNSQICNPGYVTGDGSIEIQIENPPAAPPGTDQTDYEVTLFQGVTVVVPTFTPVPPVNPFIVSNTLAPNSYIVEVVEKYSGFDCVISQDVIIGADALPPVLSLSGAITPNTFCPPSPTGDGRIDILVDKDPDDLTAGTTYDIDMAPDPNAAFPILGQAPPGPFAATGLGPASYTFTATASTGCSISKSFTVINNPVVSQIVAGNVSVTNAEFCDVALEQSARIVINQLDIIGGGPENLDDYRFDWYTDASLMTNILSAVGDNSAAKGGEVLSNTGAPLPVPPVTNGAYWVTATKLTDVSATGGVGCTSASFSVNIAANKVNPQITLTPFSDTSCDPTFFEGGIQVDVTTASGPGVGGTYDYTWVPTGGPGEPANSVGNSGVANIINNINDGSYTLTALNQLSGCFNTLSTTIARAAPPVFTVNATATNLTNCSPFNGLIDNLQVFVNGAPGAIPDFDYVWFQADLLPGSVVLDGQGPAPVDTELTLATYPGIALDKYFVKAIRKAGGAGVGCESAALRRDILDDRVFPQVALSQVASTACDGNFDGQITVNATTPSGPGAGAGYNFVWTNDPDGLAGPLFSASDSPTNNTASPYSTPNTDLIGEGVYSIDVTNFVTNCPSSGSITLQKNTVPMEIVSVAATPVDVCAPMAVNGSGTVTDVKIGATTGQTALFTYTWDDDPLIGSPFVTDDPALTQGGLAIGTFYVRAKRNTVVSPGTPGVTGSGCLTAAIPFEVEDRRITPSVSLSQVSSTACDGNFDGRITVTASTASGPGAGANYDFVWTNDPDGLAGPLFSASDALNTPSAYSTPNTDLIGEGTYDILVTNVATSCFTNGSIVLQKNTVPMEIVSVAATPVDVCAPMLDNGSGTVTDVKIGATTGQTALFTYTWDDDPLIGSPFVTDDPALTQGGLAIGTFYVRAKRNTVVSPGTPGVTGSGCLTAAIPFEVEDRRITPSVSLSQVSSTACDGNFDGRITVTASTASGPGAGANYDFEWTNDPDGLAGPLFSASDALNTPSAYSTLNTDLIGEGTYDILVTNVATSCFTNGSIVLQKNTVPMEIVSVAATPVDVCAPMAVNGSGTVTDVKIGATTGQTAAFTYTWDDDPLIGSPFVTDDPALTQGGLAIGTFYVRAKRNAVVSPGTPGATGSGCLTAPIPFVVEDKRITPSVSLSQVSSTACDGNFDGRITVTASTASGPGAGANYDFVWTNDPDGLAGPLFSASDALNTPSAYSTPNTDLIGEGTYDILVTNVATSCFTNGSIVLQKNTVPMEIVSVAATPVDVCAPLAVNGSGTITDVKIGATTGQSGLFTYTWDDDPLIGSPFVTNDPALTQGGLNVGTFYVRARRNAVTNPATPGVTGSGCVTSPIPFEVLDQRITPSVSLSQLANTACDGNFDGQITVTASTASGPGVGANYAISWLAFAPGSSAANPGVVPSPYSTSAPDIIGPGNYTVQVNNATTFCFSTASIVLQSNPQPLDILTVSKTDQLICYPDGSITVSTLSSGGTGNYTYEWFKNDPATPRLVDNFATPINVASLVTGTAAQEFPTMGFGTYFVKATKNAGAAPGSGCVTPPFRVDIQDLHMDPRVQMSYQPNSSCDPVNPNGVVLANAAEQSGFNGDTYSFTWTFNGGALPGSTIVTPTNNSNQLTDAGDGTYTLVIQNTSATGCSFTSSLVVQKDLNVSLPNIIDAITVDPLDCLASGSATVTRVGIGGVTFFNDPPDDLDLNFDYKWYQGAFNPAAQIGGEVNHDLLNRLPGTYYVTVQDGTTLCESGPKEVVIKDDQIIYPDVRIMQTARQISCDAITGTAALAATADGQTDTNLDYNFAWYNTLDATGPSFAATSTITGQQEGNYSVEVLRTSTGCSAQALFIVPDEAPQFTPVISLGGQGRTLCVGQDGLVLARVIDISPVYPFAYDFTADLYNGANPNLAGPPNIPNMAQVPGFAENFAESGLAEGFYTVRITDNNTGCFAVATQEVLDQRMNPVVAIVEENPLTNCDPAIANGQLSATADNGSVGGFNFEWYAGSTITSPPAALLSAINKLIGRGAGNYVVRATNKITGCFADLAGAITDATLLPPVPDAVTLRDRTNCIDPNGIVTASVGGITFGYDFDWYDGATVSGSPDFNGVNYFDLDIGDYSVTATDILTGCVSNPATTPVADARRIPEFIIETTPSFCRDTGLPNGNGSVILSLTNQDGDNVVIDEVDWIDTSNNQPVGIGTALYELFPGFYQANVVTLEGCTNDGVAEVKTEIAPFNGISNNSDGSNDVFIVDCISLFPNNNVKIFNRNGIKVFEADGYNNADVSFTGLGIRGLYLTGQELPVGTYYYIIDKRDGSKPIAGYLELDR